MEWETDVAVGPHGVGHYVAEVRAAITTWALMAGLIGDCAVCDASRRRLRQGPRTCTVWNTRMCHYEPLADRWDTPEPHGATQLTIDAAGGKGTLPTPNASSPDDDQSGQTGLQLALARAGLLLALRRAGLLLAR